MKIIKTISIFLFVVLFLSITNAQELKVVTHGVSPRDVERDSVEQYFNRVSTGMKNVGIETKVYLKGYWEDSTLTSPNWTFLEKPAGSAAAFGTTKDMNASTQINTFVPDLTGIYSIQFTDGTVSDTVRISAGLYLGATTGTINCKVCHNSTFWDFKYDKWLQTGHGQALKKGLDGEKGTHFSNNCVSCHTTGFDEAANNNGFDDFSFVFPDTLMPGMFDSLSTVYPEAMARANVQCESCHGPGSLHNGNRFNISDDLGVGSCNVCHNAGTHHVIGEQWLYSGVDATEFDGRGFHGGHSVGAFVPRGASAGCAACHSGSGFVQWIKEDRPVNSSGLPGSIAEVPPVTKITCATCHDPHDATIEHQLRFADTQLGDGTPITMEAYGFGAVCMQCHRSRREAATYSADVGNASSHYGPHHGPQADMLIGANAPDFGIELPSSPHDVATVNACVDCHMAGEEGVDAEGNVILVGGHSFNMNDAEGNDHVEACAPCHGNVGPTFKDKKYYKNGNADHDGNGVAEGLQLEVHGLMTKLALLLPPVGEDAVSDSSDDSTLTSSIMKAAYAYIWVEEDRSFGIHNPAFTVGLLNAAIQEVGGIVSVSDENGSLPTEYELSQNYPNPFNPSTLISFSLPTEGMTTLKIYDAIGREVVTLVNEMKNAGTYTYEFNARNLSSGIYIYSLNSSDFNMTKKMLLIK